jgi:hypothetical protein
MLQLTNFTVIVDAGGAGIITPTAQPLVVNSRTTFMWIKWSAVEHPTSPADFSDTQSDYLGIYVGPNPVAPADPAAYDWRRWKGEKGDPATIQIGTVTTGTPGTDAQVINRGTENSAILDFTIPAGDMDIDGLSAETSLEDTDYIPFRDTSATANRKGLLSVLKNYVLGTLFDSILGHKHDGTDSPKVKYSDVDEAPTKATPADVIAGLSDTTYITPAVLHEAWIQPIFGVSWDGGENPTLTRINTSQGMVANAGVDSQVVRNDFDYAPIFSEIEDYVDDYSNQFVSIPKFYIKKTANGAARTWQISKRRIDGAYLPTCFWDFEHERELPYVLVGKYTANLSDDGTKLESKSGKWPLVNKNIVDFRNYAKANGTGYQQLDGVIVDLLQTLFYVEFATLNSQSIMMGWVNGRMSASDIATVSDTGVNRIIVSNATAAYYKVGQPIGIGTTLGGGQIFNYRTIVSIEDYDESNKAIVFDGNPVNISAGNIIYNIGWKSGVCSGVVASSGSIYSNSDGKNPFKYRGIENLWGNVFQWVDGININNNQAWISRIPSDYASNLFASPYQQLSYINHNVEGYVSQMGFDSNNPEFNFPTSITGGAYNKYYSDYYFQETGQRVALLGGSWRNGSAAGLSYWLLNGASWDSYVNVGGRLVKKALE